MHSRTEVLSGVTSITWLGKHVYPIDKGYVSCLGDLLPSLWGSRNLLLELHDQLLVAGQEVPPGPGVADSVSRERHAVVKVSLGGNVLQWKSFDVAVRVTVGEYVNSLSNVEIISQMDH